MQPLENLRIIAIEQYGAGPFGTMHLADLGAEVIKVEDPRSGGDVSRYVPPLQDDTDSLFFESFNRNKKSMTLDLSTDAGRGVFEDLVRVSDVVYSNLRGDVPERLRIRYDDLKHLNPAIVCVSLSGFGMTGPRKKEPGYDYILQALTGWMSMTGGPDHPPTKSGLSMVDYAGGYVAAIALLAAVHAAQRDGVGTDCDISLYDTAISLLTYPAIWWLNGGIEPERKAKSAHPSLVPFQAFEASDGWLVVACPKEKFWKRLCDVLGRPELATDERFNDFAARRANAKVLGTVLDAEFLGDSVEGWTHRLTEQGVPNGPVQTVPVALSDPHTKARGMIISTDHPKFGTVRQVASSVNVGDGDVAYRRGPLLNEHGAEILAETLKYNEATIDELRGRGAFGEPVDRVEP